MSARVDGRKLTFRTSCRCERVNKKKERKKKKKIGGKCLTSYQNIPPTRAIWNVQTVLRVSLAWDERYFSPSRQARAISSAQGKVYNLPIFLNYYPC